MLRSELIIFTVNTARDRYITKLHQWQTGGASECLSSPNGVYYIHQEFPTAIKGPVAACVVGTEEGRPCGREHRVRPPVARPREA